MKFRPDSVIHVPPSTGPVEGLSAVTNGTLKYWNRSRSSVYCCALRLTCSDTAEPPKVTWPSALLQVTESKLGW